MSKVRESADLLSHIKTGKSLFENCEIIKDYHVPVFVEDNLKRVLSTLIDKSSNEISVKPN